MFAHRWPWGLLVMLVASLASAGHAPPKRAAEQPKVELIDGLGLHEHRVTTTSPEAQKFFNQGLRLIYAFNHDEAIRAFEKTAELDPDCAMAQWGIALALGPNYNLEAVEDRAVKAYAAVEKAQKLKAKASPAEQDYIDALAKRYAPTYEPNRKPLDEAYAAAMRKLSAKYPDDLDAAVLFAESLMDLRPWDLWTADGAPQPGTEEIVTTLERVLARDPNHPGAIHYYIHAVEASNTPERALEPARRLGALTPAAGHLVHMPSHIYFRVGLYQDSVEANRRAVDADRKYIERFKPQGVYPMMYYPHNIHFLWASLCMEGRSAEAIAAADELAKHMMPEMVKDMPMVEYFTPVRLYSLVLFEKWDEILKEPAPPADLSFFRGMWHYAQGMAQAGKGNADQAERQQIEVAKIIADTPDDILLMRHAAAQLLRIAYQHLAATNDLARGNTDEAIKRLELGVKLQGKLSYDEPPPWYFSMRTALGAALLQTNRAADAEAAFREDLKRHPESGRALRGLELSLRAQNRAAEADEVHKRFEKAWARADVKAL